MEEGLGQEEINAGTIVGICLNPCFNGRGSRTLLDVNVTKPYLS